MIIYKKGDLFEATAEAIVNTVNTVGIMGKGIALQFKKRFPLNYEIYKKACEEKTISIGKLLITESNSLYFKYIINFPTKVHWRNHSEYSYIEKGMEDLILKIKELNIQSVAMPPLGAGNGQLVWEKVKVIIEKYANELPEVAFYVYEPQVVFEQRDNIKSYKVNLTPIRAMLLSAFKAYEKSDANLNLLVTQKVAYFLQRMGEPMRLKYTKGWYGPYAANLDKVLQAMNGSFVQYEAQNIKPDNDIKTIDIHNTLLEESLSNLSDVQKQRLDVLVKFMEGFETPFSLEILATVDWILEGKPELNPEQIYEQIGAWTKRKSELIKPFHVEVAYKHLKEYDSYLIH